MGQFGCVGRYNVTYSNTVSIQRPVNSNKPRIKQHPQGFIATVLALLIGLGISGALLVGVALALIFPKLPDLDTLTDYRPKVPLRVYSAEGELIGLLSIGDLVKETIAEQADLIRQLEQYIRGEIP